MEDKDPFDPLGDLDSLFSNEDDFQVADQSSNILVIGEISVYSKIEKALISSHELYTISYVDNLDESVVKLLQELFAVVVIDQDDESLDAVSVSRVVRTNHPMARIVVVSKKRGSQLLANIINHGSVDAFLTYPLKTTYIQKLIASQVAEHEITKMLTSFVSSPPKLSKASYLLLDPSLSFADESKPVKFVGIMVVFKSVPRYTKFFEELLAKDEILFAGYLSGVAMLGRELLTSKEPLKEINFGGVSVIFRFHDEIQISIFVRNLTKHNAESAEAKISQTIDKLLSTNGNEISQFEVMSDTAYQSIADITSELDKANESLDIPDIKPIDSDLTLLIFGSDGESQSKFQSFIKRVKSVSSESFTQKQDAINYLSSNPVGAILLDSTIEDGTDPLEFAEHAKEITPFVQVIYRARDRRTSAPLIDALNSGHINFIIPYKLASKDTADYVTRSFVKATELKHQSETGEGLDKALDQATIAKTMIKKNLKSYQPETSPELHGIYIFQEVKPIFQIFWEHEESRIEFDDEMMAGLVSSLNAVGGEMFTEEGILGGIELGGAQIIVEHHEDFKVAFFLKNLDPNTFVVIQKEIKTGSNKIFEIVDGSLHALDDLETKARFDTVCNHIYSNFIELFG